MSTLHTQRPPHIDILTLIAGAVIILMCIYFLNACTSDPTPNDYYENWVTTLPAVQDTPCIHPVEIIHPDFLTMYMGVEDPQTEVLFVAGSFSTTLMEDTPSKADSIIAVLKKFNPAYDYTVYMNGWFNFAIIIDGTNDKTLFQLKVHVRADGLNRWPTFSIQAFFFGGVLTYDEYVEVIKKYPSCRSFNFRELASTESQRDTAALLILGDCKEGRYWADFAFNSINDTIPPLFDLAGWEKVLTTFSSGGSPRAYAEAEPKTIRLYGCATDMEILGYLHSGYNVITEA